jgi:hypothetical protein
MSKRRHKPKPTKEQVKSVMDEVEKLNLSDGAYLAIVHECLGLEYGEVFDIIEADPAFFGYEEPKAS